MADSRTLEFGPGKLPPSNPQAPTLVCSAQGVGKYWHITTHHDADVFNNAADTIPWWSTRMLGHSARAQIRVTRGQYQARILMDWGQTFGVAADKVQVDLLFPSNIYLPLAVNERFSAAATPSVAGEGRAHVYLTESRRGLGATSLSEARPIPPNASDVLASAVRTASIDPPTSAYLLIGDDISGEWFARFEIESAPRWCPCKAGSNDAGGSTVVVSGAHAVRVRNDDANPINFALTWKIQVP